MKKYINMKCRSCKRVYVVSREYELGSRVVSLECNWCPECMHNATTEHEEYAIEGSCSRKKHEKNTPINQQKLF